MARQRNTQPGASSGTGSAPMTTGAGQGPSAGVQGRGVMDQAKDKAQQLAGQAREQTTQRVESGLSQGKARAATTLGTVAQTLRQSAQPLRDQNQAGAGQYIEQAASQVQRLSDYLQNTDVHEIVDGVERAARRQPALFLGGAFALGLLGARFIKSSRRSASPEQAGSADYLAASGTYAGGTYRGDYAGAPGGVGGDAYGGGSSLDRDVTGSRGVGSDMPGAALASGAAGAPGATGTTGAAGRTGPSGLGSGLGGSGSTGEGGSALDPDGTDRI